MYFGRNLDWSFSYGETILVTPRGYQYDYVYGAEGKSEPNAVIGVGVVMVDRPMYFDCANEHGLAIAGLNFPGYASFAHEPVEGTENVATFEFPLWVTRNFDTVDEVEEALKNVTLVSQVVPGQQESLLHWFIGDGTRSIVVEQMARALSQQHAVQWFPLPHVLVVLGLCNGVQRHVAFEQTVDGETGGEHDCHPRERR